MEFGVYVVILMVMIVVGCSSSISVILIMVDNILYEDECWVLFLLFINLDLL